jgi:hypothetical protein
LSFRGLCRLLWPGGGDARTRRAELEAWHTSLTAAGVVSSAIEASPLGFHLNLKDPDNIAIELFVSQPA